MTLASSPAIAQSGLQNATSPVPHADLIANLTEPAGSRIPADLPEEPVAQNTPAPPATQTSKSPLPPNTPEPASSSTPSTGDQDQTPEERRRRQQEASEIELRREEHQRIAGVVPNFNAVLGGSAPPLTFGQKMRASFHSAVDPWQFGIALFSAGYGQATDSHTTYDPNGFQHGYRQGAAGFFKRYGAAYADQFDGTILGNGVFPGLLHQDARYYRLGEESGHTYKYRIGYSALTTVMCKGDNRKWQPSISNLLGNIASGGISNIYYPAADRGIGLTFVNAIAVTLEGTLGALLIEFYPDFKQHVLHGTRPPE